MAAGKKIYKKNDARKLIIEGMHEVASTVSSTFGPKGRTVAFDRGGNVRITKDGISVAKEIKFSNEAKNFGCMLIKEAAGRSNYLSGDGSTTTTILTYELCKEAYFLLTQGIDINALRSGYKAAQEHILNDLENYKNEIDLEEDIYKIAKVSANNDDEIASKIKEAFLAIGDNGIVSIADSLSRKGETTVKLSSGLEFDKGFLSSLSVNSTNDQCVLVNPKILLSNDPLNTVEDLQAIVQPLQISKTPIIIIAPDFDDEVLAWFRELLSKKAITGCLILAPGGSKESISDNLLDLSLMINAQVLYRDFDLNEYDQSLLGTAEQVTITKNRTTILGADTDEKRLEEHLKLLQAKVDHDSADEGYSEYQIETIKERIAKMTGGVATILVGALSAPELGEKKDRYEDAVNAVRAALKDGYVPGAGTALLRSAFYATSNLEKPAEIMAWTAFMKAIKMPAKILIYSSGEDYETVISDIMKTHEKSVGYNVNDKSVTDLIAEGIIDPYKIVYNSLLYASNMAEQFMSIDSVIVTDVPNMSIESLDDILNEDKVIF